MIKVLRFMEESQEVRQGQTRMATVGGCRFRVLHVAGGCQVILSWVDGPKRGDKGVWLMERVRRLSEVWEVAE